MAQAKEDKLNLVKTIKMRTMIELMKKSLKHKLLKWTN